MTEQTVKCGWCGGELDHSLDREFPYCELCGKRGNHDKHTQERTRRINEASLAVHETGHFDPELSVEIAEDLIRIQDEAAQKRTRKGIK